MPLKSPALQGLLIGADYTILLYAEPREIEDGDLQKRIANFLTTPETWRSRERKGKRYGYNLRPLILELHYEGYDARDEEHRIFLRVQQRAGATGRPDEVVSALGFDNFARTLRRERLYFVNQLADTAVFAAYPVTDQSEIMLPSVAQLQTQHASLPQSRHDRPAGRTISEHAADEFT